MNLQPTQPLMLDLKTACALFSWKYDTMWKLHKAGKFVPAFKQGKMLRFKFKDVEKWATREPVSGGASLVRGEL